MLLLQGRPKWCSQAAECNTKYLHIFIAFRPHEISSYFANTAQQNNFPTAKVQPSLVCNVPVAPISCQHASWEDC